jgi:hypothetical protein
MKNFFCEMDEYVYKNFKMGQIPSFIEGIRREIITFGKLAGMTYEQALANDPEHCQWTVENDNLDTNSNSFNESVYLLVKWLTDGDRLSTAKKRESV